jgi:hypothetical protein
VSACQPRGPHLVVLPRVHTRASALGTSRLLMSRRGSLNLRTSEGAMRAMKLLIQRSSLDLDPMAILAPRDFATRDLEHPTPGLSSYEPPSSRDPSISATCPPQMDGPDLLATSPLAKSRCPTLAPSLHETPRSDVSFPSRVLAIRDFASRRVELSFPYLTNPRDARGQRVLTPFTR